MRNGGYKIGVPVWPGTNCERDVYSVVTKNLGLKADYIWHTKDDVGGYDALVLPGGFTYGDRLRAGAIAAHSPIMSGVKHAADDGLPVLGICNGFQILAEAGLLPGALIRNESLRFECRWACLTVSGKKTPFTYGLDKGSVIRLAVANGEGRYYNTHEAIKEMQKTGQIIFRYTSDNVSGSLYNVAGVCNEEGNVMGMMPHPDRASDLELGGDDGMKVFRSLVKYLDENI